MRRKNRDLDLRGSTSQSGSLQSERGNILSKIGLIALATALALLLTGGSYAADKIGLNCSGTLWHNLVGAAPAHDQGFIVDLDKGSVSTALGDFPITKLTEGIIDFEGNSKDGETWRGVLDRLAGHISLGEWRNNNLVAIYGRTCQRANPLF